MDEELDTIREEEDEEEFLKDIDSLGLDD